MRQKAVRVLPPPQGDGVLTAQTINGIPRRDLTHRPLWKRKLAWWMGARWISTVNGLELWRKYGAPVEAPLMKATGGRIRLSVGIPIVVLVTTGARSGQRRESPLAYFTDGDDVILIASNYGTAKHPGWYHNLIAHPECELRIGPRGGRFVARQVTGPDRDRLYALAADRLIPVFPLHEQRCGTRSIPVMRLTAAGS